MSGSISAIDITNRYKSVATPAQAQINAARFGFQRTPEATDTQVARTGNVTPKWGAEGGLVQTLGRGSSLAGSQLNLTI